MGRRCWIAGLGALLLLLLTAFSSRPALAAADPLVSALVLDFQQDGVFADADARSRLYAEACAAGRTLGCDPSRWRPAEVVDRAAARAAFTPACDGGDPAACLALGWMDSQLEWGVASPRALDPGRGAAHFRRACDARLDRACAELGQLHLRGVGVERDIGRARALLDQACGAGIGNACSTLGFLQLDEEAGPADPIGAVRTFIRGCNRDDAISCLNAARSVEQGLDGPKDIARIDDLIGRACQAGLLSACLLRAERSAEADRPPREAAALALTRQGCAGGDDRACAALARRLLAGEGLPADRSEALRLLRRSCDDKVHEACIDLADAWMDEPNVNRPAVHALLSAACAEDIAAACARVGAMDVGPPETTARGLAAMDQACTLGLSSACVERGYLYLSDVANPPDPAAAFALWAQTCERDPATGCEALGLARLSGTGGTEPDPPAAVALFERGCGAGNPTACNALGQLHQRGVVVEREPSAAARYYTEACSSGDGFACVNLAWAMEQGFGLERNLGAATRVYEKACQDGIAKGCAHLALLEVKGLQVALPAPPRALLKQACLDRSAAGCAGAGYLAVTGADGGPIDVDMGVKLLTQSCSINAALRCGWDRCETESPQGCRWLSELYAAGDALPRSRRKASTYAEAACRAGDLGSCDN